MPESEVVLTDEETKKRYRAMLLSVGFCEEVADGVTKDVFGAIEEAQQELTQ